VGLTILDIHGPQGNNPIGVDNFGYSPLPRAIIVYYYIDRCELWGFIGEIYSDISYVKYQFFPAGTTFTQL
jgi:hypothetical protein